MRLSNWGALFICPKFLLKYGKGDCMGTKSNKNISGVIGAIGAVGGLITAVTPLVEKAIDNAQNKPTEKIDTKVIIPELYRKGFPIDLEQAEDDAPPKSAFGNGARLSANGLGLAQDKVDGRRKTDERDGGSEHAETPHKLKRTKAGVYPIVTKICAAIGGCAQQPAILTRTCGGVAQCSGGLRDNGRELHGNVKAS